MSTLIEDIDEILKEGFAKQDSIYQDTLKAHERTWMISAGLCFLLGLIVGILLTLWITGSS